MDYYDMKRMVKNEKGAIREWAADQFTFIQVFKETKKVTNYKFTREHCIGVHMTGFVFKNCIFDNTQMHGRIFRNCEFINCVFINVNMSACNLAYVDFKNCYIDYIDMQGSYMLEFDFRKISPSSVNLANCEGIVSFSYGKLSCVYFMWDKKLYLKCNDVLCDSKASFLKNVQKMIQSRDISPDVRLLAEAFVTSFYDNLEFECPYRKSEIKIKN